MPRTIIFCACLLLMAQAAESASSRVRIKQAPQRVKSLKQLAKLLGQQRPKRNFRGTRLPQAQTGRLGSGPLSAMGTGGAAGDVAAAPEFSGTNVQVAGVDEADIVKNDGQYLYLVQSDRVLLIKAHPETELAVSSAIRFDSNFSPFELFVDGNFLAVIGSAWNYPQPLESGDETSAQGVGFVVTSATVRALVYDISDKVNPALVRTLELEGWYLSSRKIGTHVYLVSRKYPEIYEVPGDGGGRVDVGGGGSTGATESSGVSILKSSASLLPEVADSADGGVTQPIDLGDVYYFPKFTEPDYVVVAAFDMTQAQAPASTKAFLGAGEHIFASLKHLYVAAAQYAVDEETGWSAKTSLYKFQLNGTDVQISARGEVPGSVLNQFSLDEHEGLLRVATTLRTANGVYVLDEQLHIIGKAEGIAPDERIYSTRFIGPRCYMVTFRQIDPLFVVGLDDPRKPKVLGKLEIPGFSTYLHPYDDNHILGFGMGGDDNGLTGAMKVALFDVSDVAHPVQRHAIEIGDWASSEVLYNHKALLFDRTRNLLAFPVWSGKNWTEALPGAEPGTAWFEGAHVYELTLENGFVLKRALSHYSESAQSNYSYGLAIRRLQFILDNLYSISDCKIKVHALPGVEDKAALDIGTPVEALPIPMAGVR